MKSYSELTKNQKEYLIRLINKLHSLADTGIQADMNNDPATVEYTINALADRSQHLKDLFEEYRK